jgi:integrase
MWRMFLDTGARWNELRQASWSDVDLWRGLLTLRAESTKARRQRVIPLRRDTVEMLRELQALQQRALRRAVGAADRLLLTPDGLGYAASTNNPMRTLDRVLERAGIQKVGPDGRKLDLHALRHTFATRLARAGVGLAQTQRLLGHSDPKLTARVYTHLEAEDLREAVEAIGAPPHGKALAAAR